MEKFFNKAKKIKVDMKEIINLLKKDGYFL